MRETAPFLLYKRGETWSEKVSRVIEDEVLSDRRPNASPLPFSIASFVQVSGGSRCFEERPCASGSTCIVSLSCADEQASAPVRRPVRL